MKNYYLSHPKQYTKHKTYVKNNDNKYKQAVRRHHLTDDDFNDMMRKYSNKCWSCKEREATCIDHDHKCCMGTWSCGDCVKGVLCNGCNSALGLLQDNIKYIDRLKKYLVETRDGSITVDAVRL